MSIYTDDKRTREQRYQQWEALADDYGTDHCGTRVIPPTDLVDYPRAIMSLLSDVQEQQERGMAMQANDGINAAKMMLCRMKDAAREAERRGA